MTNTQKNQPIDTVRDGAIKATIWRNSGNNGVFYSVEFSRTYRNPDGEFHDSAGFSGSQLLRLARLADIAYTEVRTYETEDRGEEFDPESHL